MEIVVKLPRHIVDDQEELLSNDYTDDVHVITVGLAGDAQIEVWCSYSDSLESTASWINLSKKSGYETVKMLYEDDYGMPWTDYLYEENGKEFTISFSYNGEDYTVTFLALESSVNACVLNDRNEFLSAEDGWQVDVSYEKN